LPTSDGGITRRRLLATGGAASAAAVIGIQPWTPALADDVPSYLIRSSYLALSTPDFAVGVAKLRLEGIYDLPELAGSEDAFSLVFSGGVVEAAIQAFSHPDLGQFELFIAPVEGRGLYEALINRSVNAPKHYPKPKPTRQPGGIPNKNPAPSPGYKATHLQSASLRRASRGVVCDLVFHEREDLKRATVWLSRGGLVVATKTVHDVRGKRLSMRLLPGRRARGGRYEVTVATKDRHGHVETKLAKLTLH
jgi:hypothetical protein